ncbi:MAG: IPT/TIG domain-containing protein, partial [Myxococcota bacterium]
SMEVTYDVRPMETTVLDQNTLEFNIDFRGERVGAHVLRVRNKSVGLSSKDFAFDVRVAPPRPTLTAIVPSKAVSGEKTAFCVFGSFEVGARIMLAGNTGKHLMPSRRKSRSELCAEPTLDLSDKFKFPAGEYDVFVQNPDGQVTEKSLALRVSRGVSEPSITRILPFSWPLGAKTADIVISGDDFLPGAVVRFGGKELAAKASPMGKVSWRSSNTLLAEVNLTDTAGWNPGDYNVVVRNPNGKVSPKPFQVTIAYPVPEIEAVSPVGASIECDQRVCVTGINLARSSSIQLGNRLYRQGASKDAAVLSGRQLCFTIKKGQFRDGTYRLLIDNGAGVTSKKRDFIILRKVPKPEIRYMTRQFAPTDSVVEFMIWPKDTASESFSNSALVYFDGKPVYTKCEGYSNRRHCYALRTRLNLEGKSPKSYKLFVANACMTKILERGVRVGP